MRKGDAIRKRYEDRGLRLYRLVKLRSRIYATSFADDAPKATFVGPNVFIRDWETADYIENDDDRFWVKIGDGSNSGWVDPDDLLELMVTEDAADTMEAFAQLMEAGDE